MLITYLPIHFFITFASAAHPDTPPLFILRSMMGKELRSMCCIANKEKCAECMYNQSCAYSFLFETILKQSNEIVPGRDRASHPFAFTKGKTSAGKDLQEYDFTITLFGKAVDYLPYIYAAFVRAGKTGIFKSRTPFSVEQVLVNGKNILIDSDHIDTGNQAEKIEIAGVGENKKAEMLVELKSPLRFKVNGEYTSDFSAKDFMNCLYRRAMTLCRLYGNVDEGCEYVPDERLTITERNLHWSEKCHYSARQKKAMELGGVTGTFKIEGDFSPMDLGLLEFAKIANAGKNTGFGLGQFDFWTKWE